MNNKALACVLTCIFSVGCLGQSTSATSNSSESSTDLRSGPYRINTGDNTTKAFQPAFADTSSKPRNLGDDIKLDRAKEAPGNTPQTSAYTAAHANVMREQFWLSIAILVLGGLLMGAQIARLWVRDEGWGPHSSRVFGITLIVTGGLFLITAGYSESQIAPMIGLLGTIAGYLLGSHDHEPRTHAEHPSKDNH